jgi:cytochrome c oxidase subunit 2
LIYVLYKSKIKKFIMTFHPLMIFVLPTSTQIGLQEAQSLQMRLITLFYEEITFYLIMILTIVSYILARALYTYTSEKISDKLTELPLLEFLWTTLPALILAAIAIPSFLLLYQLDTCVRPSMTLRVIGHQWYWSYEASTMDGQEIWATDSYLVAEEDLIYGFRLLESAPVELPSYVSIRCLVTSNDVLHSWAVPSLGMKVDAVPGRINLISLQFMNYSGSKYPTAVYGQCSELCGSEHPNMPIKLIFTN